MLRLRVNNLEVDVLKRILLTCAALALLTPVVAIADPPSSGYIDVNGLHMYYEIHGRGDPLIMLHGGVAASEKFGPNIDALAMTRKVIVVHLQGHGNTKDIDRPYRFEQNADDVAALAAKLNLMSTDVLGWSYGGDSAIQLAIRHPKLVHKLVVVSAPMTSGGWYPEVLDGFTAMHKDPKTLAQTTSKSPLAKQWPNINWETMFSKMGELQSQSYDWTKGVATLKMPVMLVYADADAVRPEHIVAFWKAIGGGKRDAGLDGSQRPQGRLAILPNTTHYSTMDTTAVADAVAPFLAAK